MQQVTQGQFPGQTPQATLESVKSHSTNSNLVLITQLEQQQRQIQRQIQRQRLQQLPPVPLFDGTIPDSNTTLTFDIDPINKIIWDNLEMGGGKDILLNQKFHTTFSLINEPLDINVAYEGTSVDLAGELDWDLCNADMSILDTCNFTSVNSFAEPQTISPKDIFMDAPDSVPPSTAFTNLTTPASVYLDTPDDLYETSPMFDNFETSEEWPSLFEPTEDNCSASVDIPALSRSFTSLSEQLVVHPGGMSRKRSSVVASPITSVQPASSSVGVVKREKVLPAIIVVAGDSKALKRAKNTAAARKSRDKKYNEVQSFRSRIAELEAEVEHWKSLALANET